MLRCANHSSGNTKTAAVREVCLRASLFSFSHSFFFFFSLSSAADGTQGLTYAGQVLCHCATPSLIFQCSAKKSSVIHFSSRNESLVCYISQYGYQEAYQGRTAQRLSDVSTPASLSILGVPSASAGAGTSMAWAGARGWAQRC